MSERLEVENLFKQNKKRPERSAVDAIRGFSPPKFRILSEEDKNARRKFYQTTATTAVFIRIYCHSWLYQKADVY